MALTTHKPKNLLTLAACSLALAVATHRLAADPGELFPSVAPYDETVNRPIARPEQALKPHRPVEPITTPPIEPKPNPQVAPKVEPKPDTTSVPRVTPRSASANRDLRFHPFSEDLTKPFLDDADEQTFDKQYADAIGKALAGGLEERRKMVDTLTAGALATPSNNLQRYLLLHALGMSIRAVAPVADRAERASKLLPFLTDRNLAIAQARVDCLTDLMLSVSSNPSDRFYNLYAEAYAALAKLQVQAGFPRDAQETLKKARDAAKMSHEPSPSRADQLAEATAWVDRAAMAAGLWPRWQATLKTNPAAPFINTQCALLHLALYGQLESAASFAAKSDREELQHFAAAYKACAVSAPAQEDGALADRTLTVCETLFDIARNVAVHPFDKYSLAFLAGDKAQMLVVSGLLAPEKAKSAQRLAGEARDFIERGTLHPGDPPKWLGTPGPATGGTGGAGAGTAGGRNPTTRHQP